MIIAYQNELSDLLKFCENKFLYNNFENKYEAGKINKIKSNISLYDGYVGILLFLLRSYELLEKNGANVPWADFEKELIRIENINAKNEINNMYFGRNSLAYLYLQYYLCKRDTEYLNKSINIITQNEQSIIHDKKNDLLSGKAGNIILCCKIYEASKDRFILKILKKLIKGILEDARFYPGGGIYWEPNLNITCPLIGLSHGNSGIVLALIEASKLLNDHRLMIYAKLGMEYEDKFFNKERFNWPDFRTDIPSEGQKIHSTKYTPYFNSEFEKLRYMNAWCHGAPGILLTRLNYYLTTKNKLPITSISNNLLKIYKETKKIKNISLCHGISGNAIIIYTISKKINNDNVDELINKLTEKSIKILKNELAKTNHLNTDLSLFSGITGVGLMLLMVYHHFSEYAFTFSPHVKNNKKIRIKELEIKYKKKILCQLLKNHNVQCASNLIKKLQNKPLNYKTILKVLKRELNTNMNKNNITNYLKFLSFISKFNITVNLYSLQLKKIASNDELNVIPLKKINCFISLNPHIYSVDYNGITYICQQSCFDFHLFAINTDTFRYIKKIMKIKKRFNELVRLIKIKFPDIDTHESEHYIINLIEKKVFILNL